MIVRIVTIMECIRVKPSVAPNENRRDALWLACLGRLQLAGLRRKVGPMNRIGLAP